MLLREMHAGGVKGRRGQGHRGPGTQGPGKGGKWGRGSVSRQGAGQGRGARTERGGKGRALPREMLRNVLALAGGRRGREGRAGTRVCHSGMKGWAWGRSTKVPHCRASRPQYAGAPDKAERSVETYHEGQVRACDLPARWPARGRGDTGQEREGEARRAKSEEGRRGVRSDQRASSLGAGAPGGGKGERERERCVAGRVQRRRGQGDRGTKGWPEQREGATRGTGASAALGEHRGRGREQRGQGRG